MASDSTQWWERRQEAEPRLKRALQDEGFIIDSMGGIAPFQMRGRLPDGHSFYFRCRHDTCRLRVGQESLVSSWDWEGEAPFGGPDEEAASWIEPGEAIAIFRRLCIEWQSR